MPGKGKALIPLLTGFNRDEARLKMDIPEEPPVPFASSWPARVAGTAILVLNAIFLVMGCWLGAECIIALFHGIASPEYLWTVPFWIGLVGVVLAGVCIYEACYPWFVSVDNNSVWYAPLTLETASKPWELISEWCNEAGVPQLDGLELSWEPNAGADLRALQHGRLHLRIGLPLWLGMETRMLRVVVMHELGHFHQHKRLLPVLRHQELGRRIQRGAIHGGHIYWMVQLKLWMVVQRLAKPWLHYLEVDADAFAISKSSPEWIAATMLRVKSLEQSTAQTFRTVQSSLGTGVLPKDLVSLFLQETQSLTQPLSDSLDRRAFTNQESLTHPSLRKRLRRSNHKRIADLNVMEEATWIPEKSVSKNLTESFYEHELGDLQNDMGRVSVNDARCQLTRAQDAQAAIEHYFLGLVFEVAPIRPLPASTKKDQSWLGAMNARARLPLLRKTLLQNREFWMTKRDEWIAAHIRCRQLASGQNAGLRIGEDAQKVLQGVLVKREAAAADLRNATEQFSQRLSFGLMLLEDSEVAKLWPEAKIWLKVATVLREELPLVSRLLGFLEEVSFDVGRLEGLEQMPSGRRRVCESEARRQIWQSMAKAISTFERRDLSDRTVRPQFAEIFERLGSMESNVIVERMEALYSRLSQFFLQGLGDLAYAAGKAELVAGIKPWESE